VPSPNGEKASAYPDTAPTVVPYTDVRADEYTTFQGSVGTPTDNESGPSREHVNQLDEQSGIHGASRRSSGDPAQRVDGQLAADEARSSRSLETVTSDPSGQEQSSVIPVGQDRGGADHPSPQLTVVRAEFSDYFLTPSGRIDWATAEERWTATGLGPDYGTRLAEAKADNASALCELLVAERYANSGYSGGLMVARDNQELTNPDMRWSHPVHGTVYVEVKYRTSQESMRPNYLKDVINAANRQIKRAEQDRTGRGHVIIVASESRSNMGDVEVERLLKGKMTNTGRDRGQLSQVDYLEVRYRDATDGGIKMTYVVRDADHIVHGPFTRSVLGRL
jgi:hypothetical protein